MRNFSWLGSIVVAILLFIAGFFSFDAGLGKGDGTRATLVSKQLVQEHWSYYWISDGNGGGHMQSIYYPARFILVFDNEMAVDVPRQQFFNLHEGQKLVLTFRVGRWTGIKYCATVHPDGKLEQ